MTTNQNLAKHQKFEAKQINRKAITGAPYNPRTITKDNLSLLKKNIKNRGLMETLVWNKTTGNLVSGHQRLSILDQLEGRDDYDLTVAVVELTEQEEKEQNIFFNNPNAQGEFDMDMMINLISDIDINEAGFRDADLSALGIEMDLGKFQDESVEDVISDFEEMKADKRERAKVEREANPEKKDWREVKAQIKANIEEKNDVREDYFVVTFDNADHKEAFLTRFGLEADARYVKGEVLTNVINEHLGE
ncbi:MAG: ParB N-terminal domain-containing protein [Sulfuricurvum sp.]|nr:ParB N-terminal domain-containing protein [Sulfuricurvum sp.]